MTQWDAQRTEQWARSQGRRSEAFGPATEMMLDLADLRTGHRVLDVAAGTGDQTLLAAQRVGLTGYVLAVDLSSNMLKGATEAVRSAGLTNVETRIMDAKNLELDADSFDAVICRSGLMLFPNPPKALKEMRKVLKPGGKVAAMVFSTAGKNPRLGIPSTVAHRRGGTMSPMFALGEPGMLENVFRDGGFPDVAVHTVSAPYRFPPGAELIQRLKDSRLGEPLAKLPDTEREQAWEEVEQQLRRYEGPNGWEFPGEVLIGVGTK